MKTLREKGKIVIFTVARKNETKYFETKSLNTPAHISNRKYTFGSIFTSIYIDYEYIGVKSAPILTLFGRVRIRVIR